jgi:hypothetical protein
MKQTIIILLMALASPLIHSKETVVSEEIVTFEAPCYTTTELFSSLKELYKESPIIIGKATDEAGSTMSFWINPIKLSWTIIATKGNLSCVIGSGTHFKIMPNKKSLSL